MNSFVKFLVFLSLFLRIYPKLFLGILYQVFYHRLLLSLNFSFQHHAIFSANLHSIFDMKIEQPVFLQVYFADVSPSLPYAPEEPPAFLGNSQQSNRYRFRKAHPPGFHLKITRFLWFLGLNSPVLVPLSISQIRLHTLHKMLPVLA